MQVECLTLMAAFAITVVGHIMMRSELWFRILVIE
jgi:hypothetical protein